MAARTGYRHAHSEVVRDKIKASQLVNRLRENALAEQEFMTAGQIQSARILLDRVLPPLATVTLRGDADAPLQQRMSVSWEAIDVKQIEHKKEE